MEALGIAAESFYVVACLQLSEYFILEAFERESLLKVVQFFIQLIFI